MPNDRERDTVIVKEDASSNLVGIIFATFAVIALIVVLVLAMNAGAEESDGGGLVDVPTTIGQQEG